MRGDDIAERLLDFAARVIKMTDALPKSQSAKHIGLQIVRSATAGGANYEEARGAESNKDYVHKLSICLKELREARYWIRAIKRAGLTTAKRLGAIMTEADELCRIIGKSIVTAKKRGGTK